MENEFWATFSIYDHRTPRYRQALILFDRVVIPVPTEVIGNLTQEEIDRLSAEVEYLQANDVAVRFDWDPSEFEVWKQSLAGEAIATTLNKDPLYDTRLHLMHTHGSFIPQGVASVTAMPVYGSRKGYESAMQDMQEKFTLEILCKQIPVPAEDVPLEDIIHLRHQKPFLDSMYQLRRWQMEIVPELFSEKSDQKIRIAGRDFEKWTKQYQEAISEAKFKKIKTTIVSILAIGSAFLSGDPTIKFLTSIVSPLFSIREVMKPCWKAVSEKQCAPAGVVYYARQLKQQSIE
jgi:hypothetical protein